LAEQKDTEYAMRGRNWAVTLAGVFIFFLGFVLMVFVGRDYHGAIGFFAPFSLIAGLVLSVVGMLLPAREP